MNGKSSTFDPELLADAVLQRLSQAQGFIRKAEDPSTTNNQVFREDLTAQETLNARSAQLNWKLGVTTLSSVIHLMESLRRMPNEPYQELYNEIRTLIENAESTVADIGMVILGIEEVRKKLRRRLLGREIKRVLSTETSEEPLSLALTLERLTKLLSEEQSSSKGNKEAWRKLLVHLTKAMIQRDGDYSPPIFEELRTAAEKLQLI